MLIDSGAPETWPASVRACVNEWNLRRRGPSFSIDADKELRPLLADHRVLAYHCTRLLPHERTAVEEHGVRALTRALVEERLRRAWACGAISGDENDQLLSGNVFSEGSQRGRENRVACFAPRSRLRDTAGVRPLLAAWGGEAVTKGRGAVSLRARLGEFGAPTVVVVSLDLGPSEVRAHPGVMAAFLATHRGERGGSTFTCDRDISPHHVIATWQTGHVDYDSVPGLPSR